MNIPIFSIGLKETITVDCHPYMHFFILCDSFTTFLASINIPIEDYFMKNRDEVVGDSILKENFEAEKEFFKKMKKLKPLVAWNDRNPYHRNYLIQNTMFSEN
jgi:hypothetical protein